MRRRCPAGRVAVRVYLPARFRRSRRYPLLVVHDGADFLRYASLQVVLDNLIHRLEIPPLIVALTDSPRAAARVRRRTSGHARFVADGAAGSARRAHSRCATTPAARGLMGASFGAVAVAARRVAPPGPVRPAAAPVRLVRVHRHRPPRRTPVFDPVARFVNRFRAAPGRPAERIYLSCGIYESLIYENRCLVPLLQRARAAACATRKCATGTTGRTGATGCRRALTWLFPGPLWMVYE